MMNSLKRGCVTGQELSPTYLRKVGFAKLQVYNQSFDPGSIPKKDTGNFSAMVYFVTAIIY